MMKFFMILVIHLVIISFGYSKLPNKFVGGIKTSLSQNPFHASVQHNNHIICVGSIISKKHILTSASCVVMKEEETEIIAGNLKVLIGSNDISHETEIRESHCIKFVIFHPEYTPQQVWKNDIAILRLENSIEFSLKRRNIIQSESYNYDIVMAVTNWGNDLSQDNNDKYLQSIYVTDKSRVQCHGAFFELTLDFTTQSCATSVFFYDSGVTLGDSGSALVYDQLLKGIVTAFIPNNRKSFIFTKTKPFDYFIKNILNEY